MSFFLALLLSPIIGVVITLFSDKAVDVNTQHKFKQHLEAAKRNEYKGHITEAIDNYMDTLFHLENDYKYLNRKNDKDRTQMITKIKAKVDELRERKAR